MKRLSASTLIISCFACSLSPLAQEAMAEQDWQQSRLLNPSAQERASEEAGQVFIYDGLAETQVDQALDTQFQRLENMMFIRVRHPEPDVALSVDEDDCE